MQKLVATRALTYATRRLKAGDEFEARPQDVRLLVGIRKARLAQPKQAPQAPEPQQVQGPEGDDREAPRPQRSRAESERARAARRD